MSEIAKKIGHSIPSATVLVNQLEDLTYVERVPSGEDCRNIMVRITSKGDKLVTKMRNEIARNLAGIGAGTNERPAHAPGVRPAV